MLWWGRKFHSISKSKFMHCKVEYAQVLMGRVWISQDVQHHFDDPNNLIMNPRVLLPVLIYIDLNKSRDKPLAPAALPI